MPHDERKSYIQYGVMLVGAAYLAIGLIGFVPSDAINPYHAEGVGAHYLLHFFAIDPLHNIIHLAIGLSGLWAARSLNRARLWGKVTGVALLALYVAGMAEAFAQGFPRDQLLLGLVVLNSAGHTFHFATGVVALMLGFAPPLVAPAPSK
jgi:hypothetical protein